MDVISAFRFSYLTIYGYIPQHLKKHKVKCVLQAAILHIWQVGQHQLTSAHSTLQGWLTFAHFDSCNALPSLPGLFIFSKGSFQIQIWSLS